MNIDSKIKFCQIMHKLNLIGSIQNSLVHGVIITPNIIVFTNKLNVGTRRYHKYGRSQFGRVSLQGYTDYLY